MQKKNSDNAHKNMPAKTATIFRICAVGTADAPRMSVFGRTVRVALAISIRARQVKEGGPTAINIPGRVSGEGRP